MLAAIQEPMTLATDYALAALGVWFGVDLLRRRGKATRLWAYGFFALAAGAFFGGTAHGFVDWLGPDGHALVWKVTTFSIGFASFFLLAATAAGVLPCKLSRALMLVAAAKLAIYIAWMSVHDEFRYVIYDYGPSMLGVLLGHLWAWLRRASCGRAGSWRACWCRSPGPACNSAVLRCTSTSTTTTFII